MYRRYLESLKAVFTKHTMESCVDCGRQLKREEKHPLCGNCREVDDRKDEGENTEMVPEEVMEKWASEQLELKQKVIEADADVVMEMRRVVEGWSERDCQFYLGGVDISFVKGDNVNACAALVVVSFPDLEVVYEDYEMIKLTAPYISGFLAFREVDFLVALFNKVKKKNPKYTPDVILVDGNGMLHRRHFGLACHLGVLLDIPCVGVAKKLCQVDGLEKNEAHTDKIKSLTKGGDMFPLYGDSGKCLGMTLRSHDTSTNPIYVSTGHRITLDTAVWLVHKCCKYRIPEPVRQADVNSREYLRNNFKSDVPGET